MKISYPSTAYLMTISLLVLGGISVRSLQTTGNKNAPWPSFRKDVHNSGRSNWKRTGAAKSWIYETLPLVGGDTKIFASPVLGDDGTLYQGASRLYALDATTGKKKWHVYAGDVLFQGSPALSADGLLYVGCDDGYLYAMTASRGRIQWKTRVGGPLRSSPALSSDDTLYIGSEDHNLYAFSRKNGSKRWMFPMPHGVASSPVIGEKGLVYCQNWGRLFAIDARKGTQVWKYQAQDDIYSKSTPAIGAQGTLYVAFVLKGLANNYKGVVVALDSASGECRWKRDLPDYIFASPAVGAKGYIYVGCGDGNLYALEEKSGQIKWAFKTGGRIQSSPAIGVDGTVYVGAYDKKIYAINGATGVKKWDYTLGGAVQASPVVSTDGTVFAAAHDGKIYGLPPGISTVGASNR